MQLKLLGDLGAEFTRAHGGGIGDFVPAAFTNWQDAGHLWGVPFSTSPFFTIYNKSLLAKAGAPDPAQLAAGGEWTWSGLADLGHKVQPTVPAGSYAFESNDGGMYGPLVRTTLEPLVRAYGGKLFDPATARATPTSPAIHRGISRWPRPPSPRCRSSSRT